MKEPGFRASLPPVPDEARIDRLIQLALATAAREDELRNQQLGPIHLVKYVYLADLAHAEAHGGQTFTGARWRFHHFGPWAEEVFRRIDPAAQAINATRRAFPSRYDTDTVRYAVEDADLFDQLERGLPFAVVSSVRRAVHEHGSDTYGLLNHVYLTKPMLSAAPEEQLVFEPRAIAPPLPAPVEPPSLTVSARRRRKAAVETLKEAVRDRLRARLARRPARVKPPRYDEVFFDGVKTLEERAGELEPFEGEAVFSPDIWKSAGRRDPDVP